jgi:hypothetical protein
VLLGEANRGVGQQQDQDDEEVGPVPEHPGQDHCDLDHPRDGTPEVGQQFEERVGLLLDNLVRAVLGESLGRLGLGQTVGGAVQSLLHLAERNRLQVVVVPTRVVMHFTRCSIGETGSRIRGSHC